MRLTLNGVLTSGLIGFAVLLGAVYFEIDRSSRELTESSARQLRTMAVGHAREKIQGFLGEGERAVTELIGQMKLGACPTPDACLRGRLLANRDLTEVTLTRGTIEGDEDDRTGQISVFRERVPSGETEPICTRVIRFRDGRYFGTVRCVPARPGDGVETEANDPTKDKAFIQPAYRVRDWLFKSDLSYSTLDDLLPEADRRVVLVRMMGWEDHANNQVSVIKVGQLNHNIDAELDKIRVTPNDPDGRRDPHWLFLADEDGRLLTTVDGKGKIRDVEGDLIIPSAEVAPEVRAALEHPTLKDARLDDPDTAEPETPEREGELVLDGKVFHVSYLALEGTRNWRLGIVGPDDRFIGPLRDQRKRMTLQLGGVFVALLVGTYLVARILRRALHQIEREAVGMSSLQFAPAAVKSPFADVRETLHSLEQAKTAVRAMGRYVPLALVRRLFQENKEPALGGVMREVTIFFSDIEGFTTRAEEEPPDVVAQWLGRYLEVMTGAVHAEDGTVDKFIGDAVMALWNAPHESADHAVKACRAALRCQRETAKLCASAEWGGRAPLVTRIGLHVGEVMVGHFGAPDRLSYTAIGDSVNLASRLEGLNKQYGTLLLVSEDVFRRTKHAFAFRRLDHVAVKGKSQAIGVYELLGEASEPSVVRPEHRRYEQGLELYVEGRFARARELLTQNPNDPPSQVLAARCADLERDPPVEPWAGISFAQSK